MYYQRREGYTSRIKNFLKEYNGLIPVFGGIVTSGVVTLVAFGIGAAEHLQKMIEYGMTTQDWGYALKYVYEKGSELAGYYAAPAYLAGQLITYKFKKSVSNFVSKLIGGRKNV
ncbi:MAG: hypothetical protein B6U78_02665 [Candidatus Aenigmarchaeota archaeon ex4484_224]|nr:MAG: hypothetical protein B6U78_02665 [Candidatus Aenigmarchaeota archaeon ex4484_224]